MDELGEGFGDIPHDDAEAELGSASAEAGTFPSFRDGRRRRRRRGRRGREDDRTDSRVTNPTEQFPRGQTDEVRQQQPSRPYPQDPAAPQQPNWREDRPRREGQDRGRDERHRNDSFERDEDRAPRIPRRPHSDFKPATPPPQAPTARRIAILLDLPGLQREAQALGAEVAFRKLRAAIAGHDEVVHAVCYTPHDLPETARKLLLSTGFTLEESADAESAGNDIVQRASQSDWHVDAIVIAGAPGLIARIARPEGAAIEAADFAGTDRTSEPNRVLGRNCLFVP
jgi:ribonuclease E